MRLSALIAHLQYLTKPLLYALNGNSELVTQGFRTLELFSENFPSETFEQLVEPIKIELLESVFKHLKTSDVNCAAATKMIGMLGGM